MLNLCNVTPSCPSPDSMMIQTQGCYRSAVLSMAHNDYNSRLNSYASFKISDKELGQDLVQDTFIKTWSYLAKGGKIEAMKAFLYHILNNLIIDEYRKRKNKVSSLDTLLENGFEPSKDDSESLFNRIDGKAALLLISKLPAMYHKVMNMRFVEDLSLQEMSILTGKSANTMAVQVHRGLAKLRILYNFESKGSCNS